jgi:DNA primase
MSSINVEELKSLVSIIDYIKTYYGKKLFITREDSNKIFLNCPFHEEENSSLVVYSNGTYKCFGCGEQGDIINFVQKMENVGFQEACEIIADNIGYKLDYIKENPIWEEYKDRQDELTRRYWKNLQHNANALNYLINVRKISPDMIDKFRLGFTDQNEYQYRTDINNISNRLVFPILEHKRNKPKCVGMAYRGIYDEEPKYINDRNQSGQKDQDPKLSGVFIKGNLLYGLAQAYKDIRTRGFAFVTEGYFDVISMHQSGFTNTVGTMGTSITDAQMNELKKVTSNIFLLLDNDNAGKNAINKYVLSFIKNGFRVFLCDLQSFKDPDLMCRSLEFNTDKVYKFLNDNKHEALSYMIYNSIMQFKEKVSEERYKTYIKLTDIASNIPNEQVKDFYMKMIEKELY